MCLHTYLGDEVHLVADVSNPEDDLAGQEDRQPQPDHQLRDEGGLAVLEQRHLRAPWVWACEVGVRV